MASPAMSLCRATTLASPHPCRAARKGMSSRGGRAVAAASSNENPSSSSSSSSSGSNNNNESSPSSPLDFRPVFALSPPRGQPTLQDARDAMETCDTLSGQGRASCFASFGIDAERVDAWYGPVSRLEAALSSSAGAGLCSFGDEESDDDVAFGEGEGEQDDDDDVGGGGGNGDGGWPKLSLPPGWPKLPPMPRIGW